MKEFDEKEARDAAEKWCGDNKLMFDVASGYFIAGYRAAWTKAQRDAEITQLGRLDPVKITDAFQKLEAKLAQAQGEIADREKTIGFVDKAFDQSQTNLKIATEALEAVDTCAMHPGSEEDVVLLMLQTVREALAKIRGEK